MKASHSRAKYVTGTGRWLPAFRITASSHGMEWSSTVIPNPFPMVFCAESESRELSAVCDIMGIIGEMIPVRRLRIRASDMIARKVTAGRYYRRRLIVATVCGDGGFLNKMAPRWSGV
jgi:hypothetical protein